MEQSVLIGVIILISFFCESIFGFGGGLISIPLLSLLLPVKSSVTLVLLFQLLIGILVIKTAKHTAWKTVSVMIVGLLLGTFVGTYSLAALSDILLRKILAASILVFLVRMVFFQKLTLPPGKKSICFFAGLFGGYFQGVIGTGGPVLTMYLLTAVPDKTQFRATLIFLFFVTSVVRFLLATGAKLITSELLGIALPLVPLFIGIVFLGQHFHRKVPDTYYRWGVYVILLFSSISLFLK